MNFKERLLSLQKRQKMDWNDRFTKGKYDGRSVKYVTYENPGYIIFCNDNGIYSFDDHILEVAKTLFE
jgi:hypothetical protein